MEADLMKREDSVLISIRNKSVIVTGVTKGIGKGIAGVFAQLGSRVCGSRVCVLGRNEPEGATTGEALRGRGSTVIFCRGNSLHDEHLGVRGAQATLQGCLVLG